MSKGASMRLLCLAAAMASVLLSAACSGGGAPPPPPVVIFSAGVDAAGRATVWRDGEPYAYIEEGGAFHSVWVQGATVHAAGVAPNDRPLYWSDGGGANNKFVQLGAGRGMATAVCADAAGRAYIAGWDASGGRVWGGAGDALHNFWPGARPCAIAIDQDGVYTAGWDEWGAVLWRGDEWLEEADVPGDAAYYAVGASNGVTYAAGECDGLPVWIRTSDDDINVLPGYGDGIATSLHLSGGRLSVAGFDGDGGKVWAGPAAGSAAGVSVRQDLGAAAEPESVFAFGGDVYAGGWGGRGGRVWRNGSTVRDHGAGSDVYSIFVVQ
jgi:hypothetical protein